MKASENPTANATAAPQATASAPPTDSPSPRVTPTYAILRGKTLPERLSCRFGPGWMYLYKFGLLQNTVMEVIGRMEASNWILIRAVGGTNACWVRGDLMEIEGDVMSVRPVDPHSVLVWSPYYRNLTGVTAVREGDTVIVSWHSLVLRAGDDSEQVPYVVEAWVCRDGEIVFAPVGVYYPRAEIRDEAGCDEPSAARVAGAEKHGYTLWSRVDWPPHEGTVTPASR